MSLLGKANAEHKLRGKINGLEKIKGYSAYEIALINGFEGTEEEWLESLHSNVEEVFINELVDMRVGADGTTYPTAGEAIREQFSKVSKSLADIATGTMHEATLE